MFLRAGRSVSDGVGGAVEDSKYLLFRRGPDEAVESHTLGRVDRSPRPVPMLTARASRSKPTLIDARGGHCRICHAPSRSSPIAAGRRWRSTQGSRAARCADVRIDGHPHDGRRPESRPAVAMIDATLAADRRRARSNPPSRQRIAVLAALIMMRSIGNGVPQGFCSDSGE